MFSDHRPRQERHTIGRDHHSNGERRLRCRICLGLVGACVVLSVINGSLPTEYDTLVFWTENSVATYEESPAMVKLGITSGSTPDVASANAQTSAGLVNTTDITDALAIIEQLRPTGRTVYSYVRGDRSGAAIQDMLMAHAFAFSKGQKYGGACQRRTFPDYVIQPRKDLLQILGLESEMPFACSSTGKLMNRAKYIKEDTGIFTPKYLEYMHAVMRTTTRESGQDQSSSLRPKQITVHIRRGDITPCRPRTNGYPRYLPNQHYMTLIEKYKTKLTMDPNQTVRVVVYSESESYEPLDEFSQKGCNLQLDGSIDQVWKAIAFDSDVVILSRSSFSLVPAVLAMPQTKIVYTPFWHKPLIHWDDLGTLDPALMNSTLTEFRRLKATCPPKAERKRQEKQRKRNIKYS